MLQRRLLSIACLVAPALALLSSTAAPLQAVPPKAALVIVTQKGSLVADLSLRELKRMYLSEPIAGPDGTRLIPLNHPTGSPPRVAFDILALKMDPDQVGRFWIDRKIRGQTGVPKALPSVDALRRAVATVAGTVTYLTAADVTTDMKVVTIDGKQPKDPDYPLQF
jgi:hypothetical protein